jgi:hypothetical protein
MKKAAHRKTARKRKSVRRRTTVSMKIMSFFKGGKVLAGKFASVLF